MVTYTVYMKELSATSTWQDITHAVVQSKDIPIRKGFGSLSDGIDVGSLTLTIQMESLQDAALLHVSQKQVLVQADGVTIFEGVSHDDADIDLGEVSDYVFVKLKFKPYSALFEQAKVPEDTVWMDKKICDPEDTDNSLVHLLFDMIIDNLPGQLPDILSALFNVSTAITNTKTLPLVMLEAGESVEEYLTELLYQNGYAYWMELYTAIVVEPYAEGRTPTVNIPITSVVANPDISQDPYVDEKKCVVRLGKIEEYADEVVYELNKERDEKTGEPVGVQKLEPGDYYPTDSDGAPSELEADYETERENDDVELVYAEGLSYDYMARQNDPSDASKTIPAYIVFGTHELTPTQATFQLYNNLAVNVSLRNIRVLAQTAYYRNWAEKYYDESTTATEEDEIDGIWMPDAATARAFVSRYRAELKAQATHVSFQTHVALQPNTLFTITGLPYQLLVRYVTKLEEDFYEYECVAYSVDTISVGTRIRVAPKKTAQDGFSPVPVHLYALGDETAPFDTSTVVSDGTSVVSDGINRLGVSSDWTLERPTPTAGQFVWQIIGYYTPPATWPTVWSEPVRLTGDKGEQGIQGLQGLQGPQGDQGIQGPTGADGATAYSHIAYADDAEGTGFSQSPTGKAYIGFYADHTEADSEDPADYAWSLIKGADGAQGIPGPTGDDGLTAYFHTAWANSADGVTDFSTTVSAGKAYIGTYSDHTAADSIDPADYAWSLIKGEQGEPARDIVLRKLPDNIIVSSRGVLRTEQVVFTVELQNLPLGTLVWSRSDGGALEEYEISEGVYDPYSRVLDASTVELDSVTVTVSMDYGEVTYTRTASVMKISEGQPIPQPLGALASVPVTTPDGDPLVYGDHFTWDAADSGIFVWGHSYVYKGLDGLGSAIWEETENFTHLSGLAKENIEMSKREGVITHSRVVFSEYIYATKIEVMDELVANYAEDSNGIPTSGARIGADGKIKGISAELWDTILHGLIKSDALDTQDEDTNITPVPATSSPTNLWNEKALYDLFPVSASQYLQAAVFDWATYSYTKATKVNSQKIIYDRITGPTMGMWGTGGTTQVGDDYTIPAGIPSTEFEVEVDWGWNTFVILANSYLEVWRGGVKISTVNRSTNSQKKVTLVNMLPGDVIKCFVDWGIGYIELTRRYIEVRTKSAFSGIVGLRSDNYLYTIPLSQDITKWHAYSWSGAGVSTASILEKASGTPIVEACEDIGTDFVQCSGTVTYEGTPYTVDRVRRSGGSVYFYSGTKLIQIDTFIDGTAIGVYTSGIAITAITLYTQLAAALVRYLIPKEHNKYDLGQANVVVPPTIENPSGLVSRYFRNLYLTGIGYMDKINTGLGDTEVYPMDQSVATTANPTFGALTVSTINTGQGATEVYKETYQSVVVPDRSTVTLAAMAIGETKRVFATLTVSDSDGTAQVLLPSGGSYGLSFVQSVYSGGTAAIRHSADSGSFPITVYRTAVIWRIS